MPTFTPTETKILAVLADGLHHTRDELRAVLGDTQATNDNVVAHVCNIRKKLQPIGQDIAFEIRRGWWYRHVRLLHSPYRE